MSGPGASDRTPARVVRLPVRDVVLVDAPPRATLAPVIRLSGHAAEHDPPVAAPRPQTRSVSAADAGDDDAVVALLHAQLGYRAADAAATRVRLPSLADFIA